MGLLILQLTNYIDKIDIDNEDSIDKEILVKTYDFIADNYKNGELSELASKLNYDMSWLSKKIKSVTGHTYTELIKTKRLNQATFLLTTTKLSVYDIAHDVGYSNISYFYRIFKNNYGVSPKEYRNNNKH